MPIMDRLYGFREFKTVMRAQVAHNCINEGNANAVTISNKCIGYSVSEIRTATSLYPVFRGWGGVGWGAQQPKSVLRPPHC
jgi:hypothetical protein